MADQLKNVWLWISREHRPRSPTTKPICNSKRLRSRPRQASIRQASTYKERNMQPKSVSKTSKMPKQSLPKTPKPKQAAVPKPDVHYVYRRDAFKKVKIA